MARGRKVKQSFKVYEFLCVFKEENDGIPPTYEEIANHFGWSSTGNAFDHVRRLNEMGLIKLDERRRITLIGGEYSPPNSS